MATPINTDDEAEIFLTDEQQKELLRREIAFNNGETTARPFEEVLVELERKYQI
jgi:hypothetical protein